MQPDPLRDPHRLAERFPKGTDATLALPLQAQDLQMLHAEQCTSRLNSLAKGGQRLGNVVACIADVDQRHAPNPVDRVGRRG
jgi:hypothetical protein